MSQVLQDDGARKNRRTKITVSQNMLFLFFVLGCISLWARPLMLLLVNNIHDDHSIQNLRQLEAPVVKTTSMSMVTPPKHVERNNIVAPSTTTNASYTTALATLSCFSTPGCFPSSKCHKGVPQKLQRRKKWEEQSFCVEDLKASSDCLVYSFGIERSTEWEEKVARLFGCEVHAFDPTMNHKTNIAPGVTFHKLGLQADGTDMSSNAAEYDEIDSKLLLALPKITKLLGHENRSIDVLMLDCEGCEWGVLRTLACSKESYRVKQLVTEFHYQKNLGLQDKADVYTAAAAIQCLWEERWHIVSMEVRGAGPKNWDYTEGVSSILHEIGMLLYMTLQRIPENMSTPAFFLEDYIRSLNTIREREKEYEEKYGLNQSEWPKKANVEMAHLKNISRAKKTKYPQGRRKNLEFDKFDRYPEEAKRSASVFHPHT